MNLVHMCSNKPSDKPRSVFNASVFAHHPSKSVPRRIFGLFSFHIMAVWRPPQDYATNSKRRHNFLCGDTEVQLSVECRPWSRMVLLSHAVCEAHAQGCVATQLKCSPSITRARSRARPCIRTQYGTAEICASEWRSRVKRPTSWLLGVSTSGADQTDLATENAWKISLTMTKIHYQPTTRLPSPRSGARGLVREPDTPSDFHEIVEIMDSDHRVLFGQSSPCNQTLAGCTAGFFLTVTRKGLLRLSFTNRATGCLYQHTLRILPQIRPELRQKTSKAVSAYMVNVSTSRSEAQQNCARQRTSKQVLFGNGLTVVEIGSFTLDSVDWADSNVLTSATCSTHTIGNCEQVALASIHAPAWSVNEQESQSWRCGFVRYSDSMASGSPATEAYFELHAIDYATSDNRSNTFESIPLDISLFPVACSEPVTTMLGASG